MSRFTNPIYWNHWLFRGDYYLPTPVVQFYESEQLVCVLVPWTGQEHLQSVQNILGEEVQKMNLSQEEETIVRPDFYLGTSVEKKLFHLAEGVSQSVFKSWNKEKLQCCVEMLLFHWHSRQLSWVNVSGMQVYGVAEQKTEVVLGSNHLVSNTSKHQLPGSFLGEGSLQVFQTGSILFQNWKSLYFLQGLPLGMALQQEPKIQVSEEYNKLIGLNSPQPFWLGSLSQDTSTEGDVVGSIQK